MWGRLPSSACTTQFQTLPCPLLLVPAQAARLSPASFVQMQHGAAQAAQEGIAAFQLDRGALLQVHIEPPPPPLDRIESGRSVGERRDLITASNALSLNDVRVS